MEDRIAHARDEPSGAVTRRLVALVAVSVLVASCSSTKDVARTAGDDASPVASAAPEASGSAASSSPRVPGIGAGGASAQRAPIASSALDPAGKVSRFIPGKGQGITDDAIQIGMVDQGNLQATFADFFGFANPGPSTTDRQKGDALLAWMNEHGGIAGRKIDPIWETYEPESESLDEEVAERCAVFGQDRKVFATAPFGIGWECFSRHGIVAIDGVTSQFHQKEYDAAGSFMYSPNAMTTDRVARTYAIGLADAGFLTKASKIGLLYSDWPGWKAAVPALETALASRGLKLLDKIEIPRYGDAGTLAQSDSQAANATLRFKARDIDRVLFFDATFLGPAQFMNHAENQNYRPQYGLYSGMGLEGLATSTTPPFAAPKEQLVGSMAVGWNQISDAGARGAVDPIRARCRQIMKDASIYNNDEPIGMCQTLFFLKFALERSTEVSVAGLRTSIEKIGGAFGAGTGFRTFFGPRRHAGATAYRALRYANEHYEYFGPIKEVP